MRLARDYSHPCPKLAGADHGPAQENTNKEESLKRIIVVATAVVALIIAGSAAAAALSQFSATATFHGKAGTASKPAPLSFTTKGTVTTGTPGQRSGVPILLKITGYGVKFDTKDFPKCSQGTINSAKDDTGCPKGALLATGSVTATIGSSADWTQQGFECDPYLDVWNAGGGKITLFFRTGAGHLCGSLQTGSTPAWTGSIGSQGKNAVVNVAISTYVQHPVPALSSQLKTLTLNWKSQTKGKAISIASVGCQSGKRPWTVAFSSNKPGTPTQTQTVKGTGSCS